MTKKKTNAQLQTALDTANKERDAAIELADKHIKRGSELQGELQAAEEFLDFEQARSGEIAVGIREEVNAAQEKHNDLIQDAQVAIRSIVRIMSMRQEQPKCDFTAGRHNDFDDLPF